MHFRGEPLIRFWTIRFWTALLAAMGLAVGIAAVPLHAPAAGAVPSPNGPPGYWIVGSDGGIYALGGAPFHGSMGGQPLNAPVVGIAPTPNGGGYWMVASDGGIFAFGDAAFHGSMGGQPLNAPVVGIAPTPDGGGYWMVASDGGIFAFGDAAFHGSMGGQPLNAPVVAMAATPAGHGYWMVASDGGIFAFGDAAFHGSMGGQRLVEPVVSMAATASGNGYWMAAADGGIFAFGDAPFFGSVGGLPLVRPVVGMATTPDHRGYWMVASDGGVFSEGDAPFRGSLALLRLNAPIVGMAQGPGLPGFFGPGAFPSGSTGYDISWPQCPSNFPPASTVAVVGADGGLAFKHNPCLAAEGAWSAGTSRNLYMNINYGLSAVGPSTSQAYNFGYGDAADAVNYANSQGVHASVWWLDVETCSNCWSGDPTLNSQVIQGALDSLRNMGFTAGVYGTQYQWVQITGPSYLPGAPQWVAGAGPLSDAQAWCVPGAFREGNPIDGTVSFDGGPVWLIQYGYFGVPPHNWDMDYAC